MANRQTPNRTAAVGRGFFAGALLVGGLGFLFLTEYTDLPTDSSGVNDYFNDYVVPILVLAVITIFVTAALGVLVEQYVPPLRAPAGDVSRWLVVLLLGVTLGPVSLAIAYNLYVNFVGSPPLYDVKEGPVFAISALAFLVAELLTGRGKRSASLGR